MVSVYVVVGSGHTRHGEKKVMQQKGLQRKRDDR